MVWLHPSLPFVKLFPRIETKLTSHHQLSLLQDQQVLDALKEDWYVQRFAGWLSSAIAKWQLRVETV